MKLAPYYNGPPGLELAVESSREDSEFRSEAIYEGTFDNDDGEWTVTRDVMLHWALTGNYMLKLGVEIPMPSTHTTDPELKRADVTFFEVAKDSRGRDGLFYHWKFVDGLDDKTKAALKASNTSIFAPPQYKHSTTGEVIEWPIRHIAFTNYAVVPDLDKAVPLIASYREQKKMKLADIAAALKIDITDMNEEEIGQAIIAAKKPEEKTPEEKTPEEKPVPLAAGFANIEVNNRTSAIEGLVRDGHILPAAAKELTEQFASVEHVSMSMSSDGEFTDGFSATVNALKKNKAIVFGEKSGPQRLADDDNPMMREAKRRREAAKT